MQIADTCLLFNKSAFVGRQPDSFFIFLELMVRFKNRYLLVQIVRESPLSGTLSPGDLMNVVRNSVNLNFGTFGSGATLSSLSLKYVDTKSGLAIIRICRQYYRILWASLTMTSNLMGKGQCSILVLRASGTIRNCQLAAISELRGLYGAARLHADEEEFIQRKRAIMSISPD